MDIEVRKQESPDYTCGVTQVFSSQTMPKIIKMPFTHNLPRQANLAAGLDHTKGTYEKVTSGFY